MSARTMSQFCPVKGGSSAETIVRRSKQPSTEKKALFYTTKISKAGSPMSGTEFGSPSKQMKFGDGSGRKLDARFEIDFDRGSRDLKAGLALSKRIELDFSLVEKGEALIFTNEQALELSKLFPNTWMVEVFPPYLVYRVTELPPKPWPLAVAGLPVIFTTEMHSDPLNRGDTGRGAPILGHHELRNKEFSMEILEEAVDVFVSLGVAIHDIFWWAGCWMITVGDGTEIRTLPRRIGKSSPAYYKLASTVPRPDLAALRQKVPIGDDYDNTDYATTPTAVLRPGVMLSSSFIKAQTDGSPSNEFKSTTSGVLISNQSGELFVTVSTHGFLEDGLVWHPTPASGCIIGNIVHTLPGCDISLVKLNPGLRYTNKLFGTPSDPRGTVVSGISPGVPPYLRSFDSVLMNNPFGGFAEGHALATGVVVLNLPERKLIRHHWNFMENGDEAIGGSWGAPILDGDGALLGLFRYAYPSSKLCSAVSATVLEENGFRLYDGEGVFV